MIERRFAGREQPLLQTVTRLLRDKYGSGADWDLSGIVVALPGAQAARRLLRLLYDEANREAMRFVAPEIVTPAALLEMLYTPARKIAGPMQSYFAWLNAVSRVSEDVRQSLAPKTGGAGRAGGPMAWAETARMAQRARTAAAAERLTLGQIAGQCAEIPGVCDDRRRQALAHLEAAYFAALAEAGLSDRDQARMNALSENRVSCDQEIYLVGAQDLNGLERAMLAALDSRVVAVIPAPEPEQEKFDETGSLHVDAWYDTPHSIPGGLVRFVDGPAEEADALLGHITALDGAFALEEITIGIGDEAAAESLARRLAVLGLPAFSPFGRPLSRARPAALLGAARDFLCAPTTRAFAALARHPDIETWLAAQQDEAENGIAAKPLLTSLDIYRAECLPLGLPTGGADDPAAAQTARESVTAAHDAARRLLLDPLHGPKQPISRWAGPIAALLRTVYADTQIGGNPEGRQLERGLTGLQEILLGLKDLPASLSPAVTGAEALTFVLSQAEAERLPTEPESGAGLEMMGWLELALDDAPVLLLTGLQEGCVPAGIGDDSLLPNSLRRILGLADDRRREARDGLLLRLMIESRQSTGRYVRLIVPRRGADGAPRLPSRLLFAGTAREAALRAACYADRTQDAPAALPLFAAGKTRNLAPPLPIQADPPRNEMSVSAFADYLACPYRFYLRHVLALKEQDDSRDEMDPRRFGDLLHACLAAFARSAASESAEPEAIQEYFRTELAVQSRKRFGASPPRAVAMQVRQAGRRLEAFADWQAQSVLDGWIIQPDLSEREMTAALTVDGLPFTIKGRPDRVDFNGTSYRVIDYKTGDSGKGPEEKHRGRDPEIGWRWNELQLPLYRTLLSQNRVALDQMPPGEMGYVLLSSDLTPIACPDKKKRSGGTGFVPVAWEEADHDSALRCAEEIIRNVRAGVFWPPADPPPFPASRTDPGRADIYSGLCLDSSSDRRDWLGMKPEKTR